MRLPIIVGMGGVNAAGRTSGFQSFRRMVIDVLPEDERERTLAGLAVMMGLVVATGEDGYQDSEAGDSLSTAEVATRYAGQVMEGTLVRRVEPSYFDVDALHWQSNGTLKPSSGEQTGALQFVLATNQVPTQLPDNWTVAAQDEKHVLVTVAGELNVKFDNLRDFPVKAAGQLPSGFDISTLYNSRFQPRGLQMALFGATDALRSMGIAWETVLEHIQPDQVGVYSSSGFGQMDYSGYGGMHQARMKGKRVTTKALAMGINSMPTDFINAYVLANVGIASSSVAACATFLSNLRHAVSDLQAGKIRVTESQIFDQVAAAFDITAWPVVAVKAYVGHTIAPASGDQLAVALGAFQTGILPGIATLDEVAEDVHQERLLIGREHQRVKSENLEVAILNSKGFGGNNASAVVLSPAKTEAMLEKRHGESAMAAYRTRREVSLAASEAYTAQADRGDYAPIYRFGEGMIADEDIAIERHSLTIKGLANSIALPNKSNYQDMID